MARYVKGYTGPTAPAAGPRATPKPAPRPGSAGPSPSIINPVRPRPFSKGGSVGSASKRADGCAVKGKTKGKMV